MSRVADCVVLEGVRVRGDDGAYHEAVVVVPDGVGLMGDYVTACGLEGRGYATVARASGCERCNMFEGRLKRRASRMRRHFARAEAAEQTALAMPVSDE